MINQNELQKAKEATEEFLRKMTEVNFVADAKTFSLPKNNPIEEDGGTDAIEISIKSDEPGMLIGRNGQTLFEIERILRIILNKRLGKFLYVSIDINDYKKEKIEYLRKMARNAAEEAVLIRGEKILPPMTAYERRIIHEELSQRQDISTQSRQDPTGRYVVITPR